jgi:acyl-CoA thioester hydrolase
VLDKNYKFSHNLRVRYSEIDGQKIVFNAHYSTYLDIGITEYFRNLFGSEWITDPHSFGYDPVLVKSTLQFRKPARLDDLLTIYVRAVKIGNSSLTFECFINRGDEVLVEAELIHVNYDARSGTSVPLPDKVKQKMKEFEGYLTI